MLIQHPIYLATKLEERKYTFVRQSSFSFFHLKFLPLFSGTKVIEDLFLESWATLFIQTSISRIDAGNKTAWTSSLRLMSACTLRKGHVSFPEVGEPRRNAKQWTHGTWRCLMCEGLTQAVVPLFRFW